MTLKPPQTATAATWKQRWRTPIILSAQLAAANPQRGMVVSNKDGSYQLYAWDVASDDLRQLTHDSAGKMFGYIAPDGEHIYYHRDTHGNETGHFVRVPFGGGEPQDISPDLPPHFFAGIAVSLAGNVVAFTADDAEAKQRLYVATIDGDQIGEPRPVFTTSIEFSNPALSADGSTVVIGAPPDDDPDHYRLVAIDTVGGELVGELRDIGSNILPKWFSSEGRRLLATSDHSGDRRPLLWDVASGERRDLEVSSLGGEVYISDWAADGSEVLLLQSDQAQQQLYRYSLDDDTLTRLDHPSGTYWGLMTYPPHFAPNGEIVATWQDSTHPEQVVALDAETGTLKRTLLQAGDAPAGQPWRSVTFTSADGTPVQGWVAIPEGDGPHPTILHTHGGPASFRSDQFATGSQMWLDHGFAFLTINYRGSIGFGREFQEAIYGRLGQLEVQDMVAAHNWLVDNGIADPQRIILQGASYGGFLTLMGLGQRPELWAGGLAGIPALDWAMMYEDSTPAFRGWIEQMNGGNPEKVPDNYRVSSCLTYIESVAAPVLVIAGRNDVRCPARPIEVYIERLRELGKPHQVHWYTAGHMALPLDDEIAHAEMELQFAYDLVSK